MRYCFNSQSPQHPCTLAPAHPSTLAPAHPSTLAPAHPSALALIHPSTLAPAHPSADAPTLLFTQESRYRASSLGSETTTSETVSDTVKITIQIDTEKSKEEIVIIMSWASYRYADGDWESYPIAEYWDKIEVRYKVVFTEYQDEPNYDDIRRGQVFLAQMFYLGMYHGGSAVVQIGSDLVGYQEAAYKDADLEE